MVNQENYLPTRKTNETTTKKTTHFFNTDSPMLIINEDVIKEA